MQTDSKSRTILEESRVVESIIEKRLGNEVYTQQYLER